MSKGIACYQFSFSVVACYTTISTKNLHFLEAARPKGFIFCMCFFWLVIFILLDSINGCCKTK